MYNEIKEAINLLKNTIAKELPKDFEKEYYSKMSYSNENKLLNIEKNLTRNY